MDVIFLVDAPTDTTLSEGDVVTSRVQIAKTGRFVDPRYGKFQITAKDFASWVKNFQELQLSQDRAGLPIDVDHGPEKTGNTEAAGWVVNLDNMGKDGKTPTADQLWATVEWNSLGKELVADRRYLYLSPSYQHNYRDEEGKTHGTALVGVGLTNRPFLTMATVSLSAASIVATTEVSQIEDEPSETPDSPAHMPDLKNITKHLGLPEDADEGAILAAIQALPAEQKTLDALAKDEGKVVLDAGQVKALVADATAGREAATTLSQMRFDTAWDKAVTEGRKLPAEKDTYSKLYELDADTTLSAIDSAPVVLSTTPKGSGGEGGSGTVSLDSEGFQVDPERQAIHDRAIALSAERNIEYSEAVMLAAEGV